MSDWDDTDALAARNARLRDTVDGLMRDLRERTDGLREAQEEIAGMAGEASSADGTVTARVDSTGLLDRLDLSSRAFERTTPEQLARVITQVVREAAGGVRERVSARMTPLTSDETMVDLPDLVPGAPSLRDMFRVASRDEPVPAAEEYGGSVLRDDAPARRPVVRSDEPDEDFGDGSILKRGDRW
ncbi:YbaB/EbfC family nucleoid-associated protein [Saccharothrix violaceirubra]|uniref:DNA-binding protein YbaB n=1 Tax=Saccharothrix violaceirubra TaxID=413306 RepID=A0A7W7SXN5_9PSEU|nr:YbaB/EbfC family nucleoid-associated protein [Saccharothrix violaceirubra]MBB4962878.1 DNA-binding protein YbaB [Saccharothrix violaceirubra]